MAKQSCGSDVPPRMPTRAVYVWWCAGMLFLILLALFSWAFLGPYWEVRSELDRLPDLPERIADPWISEEAVSRLGGEREAARKLALYTRLPERLAPNLYKAEEVIGKCGRQAIPLCVRMLESAIPSRRAMAARVLGEIKDPGVPKYLIPVLNDVDDDVRAWAAGALGEIGDLGAVDPLVRALDDPNDFVRRKVAAALCKIGDRRAIGPLIAKLQDRDELVRVAAAEALHKMPDPRGLEPLIVALRDKSALVCMSAALALGELGDVRAVEALLVASGSESVLLRHSAKSSLGLIAKSCAVDQLVLMLEDPSKEVRTWAATALANRQKDKGSEGVKGNSGAIPGTQYRTPGSRT